MTKIDYSQVDYLLQLSCGYWKSQVLFTAVEFEIFTIIGNNKVSAKEISKSTHTNIRATEMLLNALVTLGLLCKEDGYYQNSSLSNTYLKKSEPYYYGDAIHHFHNISENWDMLPQTIETGEAVSIRNLPEKADPHDTKDFITAMHNIASVKSKELCRKIDLSDTTHLLDIAGGPGTYSIEFARVYPHLRAVVFDLEHVTPLTHEFITAAGMEDRVTTQQGNCLEDEFGNNIYDAILVSNLLHIYNPENNMKILKKCRDALKKDGKLIIHEFVLDESKTHPEFAALFSLNMLIGTQEGASYSESEYNSWLKTVGFKEIKRIDLESNSTLMVGTK